MRKLATLAFGGLGFLFVLGYSIHMLIGGIVSPTTETVAIVIAEVIGIIVLGVIFWELWRSRTG